MRLLRYSVIALFVFFVSSIAQAQTMRVMSYNILNFPTGNIAGRVDTLANIVDYYRPDILLVQELENETGLMQITQMMDSLAYGDFINAPFISMQSDPGNPYELQHAIVYNQDYFVLKSQQPIITAVRDVNEYVLYLNDPLLPFGADTTFLYVYNTHLKSSTGSENQQLRLQMVNAWRAHVETNVPADAAVLICGDFNLYGNTEPAYQELVSTDGNVNLQDPLGDFGNWTGSGFAHKEILTQSTRSSSIFNDGAGGGVDDRFDFILFSESMMNTSSALHFVEGSYFSLGNNGTCYNNDITDCGNGNDVPADVLQSMYYMSDHIPQVCEVETSIDFNRVADIHRSDMQFSILSGTIAREWLQVGCSARFPRQGTLTIINSSGQIIHQEQVFFTESIKSYSFNIAQWPNGLYIVYSYTANGWPVYSKFFVQH